MRDLLSQFEEEVRSTVDTTVKTYFGRNMSLYDLSELSFEFKVEEQKGYFSTNLAYLLARELDRSPGEVAKELLKHMPSRGKFVTCAEVTEPGYVNFILNPKQYVDVIQQIEQAGSRYGLSDVGKGNKVVVLSVVDNARTDSLHRIRVEMTASVLSKMLRTIGYSVRLKSTAVDSIQSNAPAAGEKIIVVVSQQQLQQVSGVLKHLIRNGVQYVGIQPVQKVNDNILLPLFLGNQSCDLLDLVDIDVLRYFVLGCRTNNIVKLNLKRVLKQSNSNPCYAVYYMYSMVSRGQVNSGALQFKANSYSLQRPQELAIMLHLIRFPQVIRESALHLQPHRVIDYLQKLSHLFKIYHVEVLYGNSLITNQAQLRLLNAVGIVAKQTFKVLGFTVPSNK